MRKLKHRQPTAEARAQDFCLKLLLFLFNHRALLSQQRRERNNQEKGSYKNYTYLKSLFASENYLMKSL